MATYDESASDAPPWYADILKVLARERNDEALRQAREQLTLSKENVDKAGELAALRLIAKAQLAKGDTWNARKTVEESLAAAKGNQKAVAAFTHIAAKVELKDRKTSEAMSKAVEAEKAYKALGSKAAVAAVTGTMAAIHAAKKDAEKAQETANVAIAAFEEISDYVGQASVLRVVLEMKMSEERFYHALMIVEEMLGLYVKASDVEGEAITQLLAAEIQVAQGDLQNAMDRASTAVELLDQVGNAKKKAAAVLVMAKAFEEAGQIQDAKQAAEAARSLFQEGRDKRGQASALLQWAGILAKESSFGAAAKRFEEAAFLFRSMKDKGEEAKAMSEAASMQLAMFENPAEMMGAPSGDEKASCAKNAARAVELFGENGAGKSADCGQAMLAHAKALFVSGDKEAASAKAQEALALMEELGDLAGQATAHLYIGLTHQAVGANDDAIEALEKSRELAEEAGTSNKQQSQKIKEIGKFSGKKKKADGIQRIDISIIKMDTNFIVYDEYQGRSMTVAPTKSSSSMIADDGKGFGFAKQKVLYNLRMQRVPNVELEEHSKEIFAY